MKALTFKVTFCLLPTVLVHVIAAQPTNSGLYDVAVLDTSTVIVVGGNGTLLRTTDGGNNWAQQINSAKTFLSVHFVDEKNGWLVGEDGVVFKTTNGGKKWLRQTLNAPELHAVYFVDLQIGWAAGANGFIAKTISGGESWQIQNSGTANGLLDICFFDADTGWAVGRSSTILKTINGGNVWETKFTGNSNLFSVFFINAITGWASHTSTSLSYTNDGGENWIGRATTPDQIITLAVFFSSEQQGWCSGSGGIIATTDGGVTWSRQASISNSVLWSIDFIDTHNGWAVGEHGVILKTSNGGQTWQQVTGQLVGVEEQQESLPLEFNLRQNYPNPFRVEEASGQATTLTYTLSRPAYVSMAVYDVLGRAVAVLVAETKSAGVFQASWNGRDLNQQPVAAGTYFCRMEITESNTHQQIFQQKKMLVLE
ncbi:T9SS type A sorting domain-containing protein [candidate division KSB1 bacterium]|nr:T9SS type A sorting domain-containing protein [candidate division KSB1 bacterium]